MTMQSGNSYWLIELNSLYETVIGDSIDLNEFLYSDVYASQVLARAGESNNLALQRLAAHIRIHRHLAMP